MKKTDGKGDNGNLRVDDEWEVKEDDHQIHDHDNVQGNGYPKASPRAGLKMGGGKISNPLRAPRP